MKVLQQDKQYKIIENSIKYYENKKEMAIIFSKIEQNSNCSIYYGLTNAGKSLVFVFINNIENFADFSIIEELSLSYNYGGIVFLIVKHKNKFYKIPFSLDFSSLQESFNLFFKKENEIIFENKILFFLKDDVYKYTKIYKTK